MARPRGKSRGNLNGLMAGTTDLEIDFVLPFEQNFAVIEPPRSVHQPERLNQGLGSRPAARATLSRSELMGVLNAVVI